MRAGAALAPDVCERLVPAIVPGHTPRQPARPAPPATGGACPGPSRAADKTAAQPPRRTGSCRPSSAMRRASCTDRVCASACAVPTGSGSVRQNAARPPHHRRHRPDTTASATPPAMTGLTQRGSQAPIGVTSAASSAASTQRLLHMQKQLPATRRQHSPIRARAELLHYLQFRQQIVRPQRHQSALQTV